MEGQKAEFVGCRRGLQALVCDHSGTACPQGELWRRGTRTHRRRGPWAQPESRGMLPGVRAHGSTRLPVLRPPGLGAPRRLDPGARLRRAGEPGVGARVGIAGSTEAGRQGRGHWGRPKHPWGLGLGPSGQPPAVLEGQEDPNCLPRGPGWVYPPPGNAWGVLRPPLLPVFCPDAPGRGLDLTPNVQGDGHWFLAWTEGVMLPPAMPRDSPLPCRSPGRLSMPGHAPRETGSRARSHFVWGETEAGSGARRCTRPRLPRWVGREQGSPAQIDPSPAEGHSRARGQTAFPVWLPSAGVAPRAGPSCPDLPMSFLGTLAGPALRRRELPLRNPAAFLRQRLTITDHRALRAQRALFTRTQEVRPRHRGDTEAGRGSRATRNVLERSGRT